MTNHSPQIEVLKKFTQADAEIVFDFLLIQQLIKQQFQVAGQWPIIPQEIHLYTQSFFLFFLKKM